MTRTISVSTDVFAAIWACRLEGEETEDTILRRVLERTKSASVPEPATEINASGGGVHDTRNNVHFPEGFEVFRTYKRQEFKARAESGAWVRHDTGDRFPTLNQLNDTIAAGPENIWNGNWKYRTPGGKVRSINDLRA